MHGAERDQPIEEPPRGAIGKTRRFRRTRCRNTIIRQQQIDDARSASGAQFWRDAQQSFGATRQFTSQCVNFLRRNVALKDQSTSLGLGRRPDAVRIEGCAIVVANNGSGASHRRSCAKTRSASHNAKISASIGEAPFRTRVVSALTRRRGKRVFTR